ncbi:MAG: hypothetical protein K8R59_00530 [Thermoanaerobaculales bacterium]|nr:hypothetical protein [Thermoanaerobaculales bacterium]
MKYTNGIGKAPNGKWRVSRRSIGGKIIRGTFLTQADARMFRDTIDRQRLRARVGPVLANDAPKSLEEAMDEYISDAEARGLAAVSVRSLEAARKTILKHIDGNHGVVLDRHDIIDFVRNRRNDGAGSFTITRNLQVLHTMIKHTAGQAALTWGVPRLIDSDEAAAKPIPPDTDVVTVYHLVAHRPEVQRAMLIALLTSLRPGDVFRLDSSDIVEDVIVAGMQKRRGQPIAIPIVPTLSTALDGIKGPLTASHSITKMVLQRATTKAVAAKQIESIWYGVQNLRRIAATWASLAGFDHTDVDILLGHEAWSLARKSYIRRRRNILADPYIELRRKMLESVEKQWQKTLNNTQESCNSV